MVSQVEDHIGVSGVEVQRAILLGAQTGRLHFAGVPALWLLRRLLAMPRAAKSSSEKMDLSLLMYH
jgi:hypothetical protein